MFFDLLLFYCASYLNCVIVSYFSKLTGNSIIKFMCICFSGVMFCMMPENGLVCLAEHIPALCSVFLELAALWICSLPDQNKVTKLIH